MFGTSELSSLTWDSAAWIYSVIIGLVIVRYFMFAANLLQQPKAIVLLSISGFCLITYSSYVCELVYRCTGLHDD